MRIRIGSKNPTKITALKETIAAYDFLSGAEIIPLDAESGVSSQPKSMEETITGATNRAKNAFVNCDYSVGIESGLMRVEQSKSGYMDFCACIIYDGKESHLGLSCAFEFPIEITRMIHEKGMDASEASFRTGLTKHRNIGSLEGAIGILTKGRVTRKEYTKQAIQMALIQLENPSFYKR
jgi:inosine/xanthosine triphosphatase